MEQEENQTEVLTGKEFLPFPFVCLIYPLYRTDFFFYFSGHSLEHRWGPFDVNLYHLPEEEKAKQKGLINQSGTSAWIALSAFIIG